MKRWIWPIFLGLTIFVASGTSAIAGPDIVNFDKLVHFLVFGLVGVLILRSRTPITWKWALASIAITSGFGAFDEFRQSFTPGRSVEWLDWIADTSGACVSIILYKLVPLYSKLLEANFGGKTRQAETDSKP
jgi:hypothetical protein